MIPAILSGGSGTRLWPVSRPAYPKQFSRIFDEALLRKTLRRLSALGEPRVVAVADAEVLTRETLTELGLPPERALYEPVARNTAPAVALLCRRLLDEGLGAEVAGVFPADHLIADEAGFRRACRLAAACAAGGAVVTLGIRPSFPSTGFGYVEVDEEPAARAEDDPALAAFAVRSFREKPGPEAAERFVAAGNFYWNAGMFLFRVEVMAGHFARLMPELWRRLGGVAPDLSNLAAIYAGIEPQSLDHGLMERLDGGHLSVPCDIGWSDVGSWDEVARLLPGGAGVFEHGGRDNFVLPHRDRIYGLVGVDDLIVVDTADALLISRRGATQAVRELVGELRAAGRPEADRHVFEHRPWGCFEVLRDSERFKSKIIRVHPRQQLSYQSHRHRSERWVIVRGRPEVVLDGEVLTPGPGDTVTVPQGAKHRIRNPTDEVVELVEIQLGSYFGEDDIVRYEDDYGRVEEGER